MEKLKRELFELKKSQPECALIEVKKISPQLRRVFTTTQICRIGTEQQNWVSPKRQLGEFCVWICACFYKWSCWHNNWSREAFQMSNEDSILVKISSSQMKPTCSSVALWTNKVVVTGLRTFHDPWSGPVHEKIECVVWIVAWWHHRSLFLSKWGRKHRYDQWVTLPRAMLEEFLWLELDNIDVTDTWFQQNRATQRSKMFDRSLATDSSPNERSSIGYHDRVN